MLVNRWNRIPHALLMLGSMTAWACSPSTTVVHAEVPSAASPARGVTVTGYGDAKAAPDIARTNLGVEVRAATAEQATAEANQRMAAVLAAVKALGIADKDLRTHGFAIHFEKEYEPPMPPPAPPEPAPPTRGGKGGAQGSQTSPSAPVAAPAPAAPRGFYRVSNMVEVTIRQLDRVGDVLKAATDAGANNVWGISFELEDPRPLLAQARAKAVEHAKKNAAELAQLTGVTLGPIVSVNEMGGPGGPVGPMMAMKAERADAASVPVERGEVTVSQQVQIVYDLPKP